MEASLFVLPIDAFRILFTVDEDPVFGQLTVTLLRVVLTNQYDTACAAVIRALYSELTEEECNG